MQMQSGCCGLKIFFLQPVHAYPYVKNVDNLVRPLMNSKNFSGWCL